MYSAGNDADIPAPFDVNDDDLLGGDKLLQAILEERGDSAAKASKRTLAIVDNGTSLVLLDAQTHISVFLLFPKRKRKSES